MSSYKHIIKATSIFGGVQVVTILVNIARSKLIAVLLGPAGMGINGMLNSAITMIGNLTNFGLSTSAVKSVAFAFGGGDKAKIASEITVLRRLVWFTGLLGSVVMFVLAPFLSRWSFGSEEYTFSFYIVAGTLLINQVSSGQRVLLQGSRQLAYLAKSTVWGAVLGLVATIPLYYYFKEEGIAYAILLGALNSLLLTYFYSRKISIKSIALSWKEVFSRGREMIQLGFFLSLSNLISTGFSYLFRIFINHTGTLEDVGYYSAGFAMISTYFGLIFTAMATDYYPRLSAVSAQNSLVKKEINQQMEVSMLIVSPILCAFIFFADWALIALYSTDFVRIKEMMICAAFGVYFKVASWSIAYVFLAKGHSKLYFANEMFTHFYLFILNVIFFKYWGLVGVGVSYCIGYLLYFFQMYKVASIKYEFGLSAEFWKIFWIQITCGAIALIISLLLDRGIFFYGIGILLISFNSYISFRMLDKKIQFSKLIREKLFKKTKQE